MSQLERLNFHVDRDGEPADPPPAGVRGDRGEPRPGPVTGDFETDEAAARFYLDGLIGGDVRPGVRGGSRPIEATDLKHLDTYRRGADDPRLVRFQQTDGEVPIYGAQMVVELDQDRGLISASGQMGRPSNVSADASLSPDD